MGLTLTEAKKRVLHILDEEPLHGYALAKRLEVRGSTAYDHLQGLEEHGYIESRERGRRKIYSLTKKGELILKAERH